MMEIDYIKSELEKIEKKEEYEKYVKLSSFLDKEVRNEVKSFAREDLLELKALKKKIKKLKKAFPRTKEKVETKLQSGDISEECKEKLQADLQKAEASFCEISTIEKKLDKQIEILSKIYLPVIRYETNIALNIIFFLIGLLSWGAGYAIKQYCPNYLWVDITCVAVMIVAFLVWKIYYWSYYCKEIAATGQIRIIVYSLKATNALLLSLIPYCGLCVHLDANQYFYIVPILVVMSIKMGASIYDFLSASKFFDSTENIITLVISILIAAVFGIASVENIFVASLVKILLVIISLWLTVLMLKKCMLDKIILDDINAIYNFVVLLLATILVSCFAIYFITWNKEPNAEQTLFSAVMGIYAAVLGGAITLGGVAWTIRKAGEDRKEEDRKKYKPIVNFVGISNGEIRGKFFTGMEFCESANNPFVKNSEEKISYNLFNLIGRNTDFSQFYMCGIIINKTRYYALSKQYVDRDEYFGVCSGVCLYLDEGITYLSLILQDLLGNEYKLPIKFEVQEEGKTINIKDMGFVCGVNTEECNEQF